MIFIEYTEEMLEMEPGPNIYWQGTPIDFLQLVLDLHILGRSNNITIDLKSFDYIELRGGINYIMTSSSQGNKLCLVDDNNIEMNLSTNIWGATLSKILAITFHPSHVYVEFDNLKLVEDANIIMSSERDM